MPSFSMAGSFFFTTLAIFWNLSVTGENIRGASTTTPLDVDPSAARIADAAKLGYKLVTPDPPIDPEKCVGPLACSFAHMGWGNVKYRKPAPENVPESARRQLQSSDNDPPSAPDFTPFERIRFHLDTTDLDEALPGFSNRALLNYIKFDLLGAAKQHVERFLRVRPVDNPLLLPRQCSEYWVSAAGEGLAPEYKCSKLSGSWNSCGTKRIPVEHFDKLEVCSPRVNDCSTLSAGRGLDNTDFVLYVTYVASGECSAETVGFGASCLRDQLDRPIAGFMNICPDRITGHDTIFRWREEVGFIVHEIFHAIGYSGTDVALFRDEEGRPRTARRPRGLPEFSPDLSLVYAADPSSMELLLNESPARARIVTPRVQSFARRYFGCPSLKGIWMENEGNLGSRFQHWERRMMAFEVMSPVTTAYPVLSPATAAFFTDSGWYRADEAETGEMVWGKAGLVENGCDFVDAPCLTVDTVPALVASTSYSPYCVSRDFTYCTHDHRAKAFCGLTEAPTIPDTFVQYFTDRRLGGSATFMDTCPVKTAFGNGHCEDEKGADPGNLRTEGQELGQDSRCFLASLLKDGFTKGDSWNPKQLGGQCFKRQCVRTGVDAMGDDIHDAVDIFIQNDDGPTQIRCHKSEFGQQKTVPGFQGFIQCPNVEILCWGHPCRNGGTRKHNRCVCALGFLGPFCEDRNDADNRQKRLHDFRYQAHDVTLWLGRQYVLDSTIESSAGDVQYSAVTPLPKGLSVDRNTGAIRGITLALTHSCQPYTIRAQATSGGIAQEARAIIYLHVVHQESELPQNAFNDCATYLRGTTPFPPISIDALDTSRPAPRPNTGSSSPTFQPSVAVTSFTNKKIDLDAVEAKLLAAIAKDDAPVDGAETLSAVTGILLSLFSIVRIFS